MILQIMLFMAGAASLVYGVSLLSVPAAFIVSGVIFLFAGIVITLGK